ncbi:WD repeat domain phosphoinositide-interacting protein [Sodiomyces alkalinus F11]|uniref:WD repeat domain phosphoinositide-interacting protein n=1 Tax=Sodiomyces alkalinus (strain CBS 110278 / VKM F-3762 / F11) TaxID=1314773 RepID=A0A3N2Q341_SODAK|nr:WD repeat domain phosphoinositide-interacting protein [Sodiomyces alkalinus F11]ROT41035.1 WD repeat domain phosphoinositide-interacting protein [Sodiomyces alkalinus F11]
MYTQPSIKGLVPNEVLSVSFNNNASHFTLGLNSGYAVFVTETCSLRSIKDFQGPIAHVEMMGLTNYLALVGNATHSHFSQNKVVLWDDQRDKPGTYITLLQPVRRVLQGDLLGQRHIVVVLQDSVRLYTVSKRPEFVSHYETAPNLLGLCCMSDRLLALLGNTPGHVQLVDRATRTVNIIPAHNSPLRALHMSRDGKLLATASYKGTLIRIWSTRTRARLAELRRGVDPSTIFHLAFNPSGTMLACTSDKSTLHIFDVPHPNKPDPSSTTTTSTTAAGSIPTAIPGTGTLANMPAPGRQDSTSVDGSKDDGKGKWGFLGKMPFMPRVFSDTYSFASAVFESRTDVSSTASRPQQGVIGWIDDSTLVVVGAGHEPKWEKFVIRKTRDGVDGKRECVREGWRRCLGSTR